MRENLQKSGGDLLIRIGKPEEIVPELVAKYKIDTLFYHSEDAWEEQQVEKTLIRQVDIEHNYFRGSSLFHLDDIPYEPANIPKTFTSFRKQVEKKSSVRKCFPNPEKLSLPDGVNGGKIP